MNIRYSKLNLLPGRKHAIEIPGTVFTAVIHRTTRPLHQSPFNVYIVVNGAAKARRIYKTTCLNLQASLEAINQYFAKNTPELSVNVHQ